MSSINDSKKVDVEFVESTKSNDNQQEDRSAEEKALVRKIDSFLLPTIWLMYLLSYMDVSARISLSRPPGHVTDALQRGRT
jgi:hypothetical protein